MAKAARKGDIGSAHGCFPPSVAIEGSDDVFINGKPAVRVGDAYAAHGCGVCAPHGRKAVQGSATVNINGKPAVRIGDAIDCGGNAETGSGNVFIGDTSWTGDAPMPDAPKMRFTLTKYPGASKRVRRLEPYKLYINGAMVQEGVSDENGQIEYEYEAPFKDKTIKIEVQHYTYEMQVKAFSPIESEAGLEERATALGYTCFDDSQNDLNKDIKNDGKVFARWVQGDFDGTSSGEIDEVLKQTIKVMLI